MTNDRDDKGRDEKTARLAAALRENLRRRKAQARATDAAVWAASPPPDEEVMPDDAS